jgi:hypothetical protein
VRRSVGSIEGRRLGSRTLCRLSRGVEHVVILAEPDHSNRGDSNERRRQGDRDVRDDFSSQIHRGADNAHEERRKPSKRVGRRETRDSSAKAIGGWSMQKGASLRAAVSRTHRGYSSWSQFGSRSRLRESWSCFVCRLEKCGVQSARNRPLQTRSSLEGTCTHRRQRSCGGSSRRTGSRVSIAGSNPHSKLDSSQVHTCEECNTTEGVLERGTVKLLTGLAEMLPGVRGQHEGACSLKPELGESLVCVTKNACA